MKHLTNETSISNYRAIPLAYKIRIPIFNLISGYDGEYDESIKKFNQELFYPFTNSFGFSRHSECKDYLKEEILEEYRNDDSSKFDERYL